MNLRDQRDLRPLLEDTPMPTAFDSDDRDASTSALSRLRSE
jgi:hypothetical protein